jgi:hypothetical protein
LLRAEVVAQHEAEDGGEHQQQREQREEREVGDEGREVAALVIAELLDDGHRERQPPAFLLVGVKAPDGSHEIHTEDATPPRTFATSGISPVR